jgi:hypothetical protein
MVSEQKKHEMVLERTHESGAEEWYCPLCGRRFLMQWPPNYKKIIIEPGDEYAIHSGGKGGLVMGAPQLASKPDEFAQDAVDRGVPEETVELSAQDKARLVKWEQLLDQMGFESLWSGSI